MSIEWQPYQRLNGLPGAIKPAQLLGDATGKAEEAVSKTEDLVHQHPEIEKRLNPFKVIQDWNKYSRTSLGITKKEVSDKKKALDKDEDNSEKPNPPEDATEEKHEDAEVPKNPEQPKEYTNKSPTSKEGGLKWIG